MRNRVQQLYMVLFGALLIFNLSAAVFAEQTSDETSDQEFDSEEYVVTANRTPVKTSETAANVAIVTHEDIEKGNYQSVSEILTKKDVAMEADSNGVQPVLNGDRRVLVMVDGRRMNWDLIVRSGSKGGVDLNSIPVENIERIEIISGPQSSLYGSDAVGGVINIITRKPTQAKTSFKMEQGSWDMQGYGLSTEGDLQGYKYLFTMNRKTQDGYEYKDSQTGEIKTLAPSYFEQNLYSGRIEKDLGDGRSLTLDLDHSDRQNGFTYRAEGYGSFYYPDGHGNSSANDAALTYRYGLDGLLRLYHNAFDGTTWFDAAETSGVDKKLRASGAEWQQSWKINESHTIVSGADWRDSELYYPSQGIDEEYFTKGIYAEDRWRLSEKWTLTAGTRYDDHSIIGDYATSRLTINRAFGNSSNLYASWGQSVKAPLAEDLFSNTDFMQGNPDLEPEKGETVTVGMNTKIAGGLNIQTSVFASRLHNAIDYIYGDGVTTKTVAYNIDQQRKRGLDFTLSKQLWSYWNFAGGYSYLYIENKDSGDSDFTVDPNNNAPNGYHLDVQFTKTKWNAGLTMMSATGRSLDYYSSRSYLTVDLVVNYRLDDKTKLFAKGYNVTNEGYEMFSNGTPGACPMPARSFIIGIQRQL